MYCLCDVGGIACVILGVLLIDVGGIACVTLEVLLVVMLRCCP
jgi:hypothetical protein